MQICARIAIILAVLSTVAGCISATAQVVAAPLPVAHVVYPTGIATPLGQQIATLLADPAVSRAHWGIAVTAIDGTPLYGLNEGQFFRPASNNKIFTTATAMALLGPNATFQTRVLGHCDAATGTVSGNLTLLGGGDANFGADDLPYLPPSRRPEVAANAPAPPAPLTDLAALADQLVAKGVKRIDGSIVGDDTLFPYEPYGDSWAADDQVWGYGAPVSALSIRNNEMKLTVTPGTPANLPGGMVFNAANVSLDQSGVPYYTVQAEVGTSPPGTHPEGVQIERLPGSRTIRVYGTVAADARPQVEEVAISDPALYAAMALRQMLEQRGIAVAGTAQASHRPMRAAQGFLSALRAPSGCDPLGGSSTANCKVGCPVADTAPMGELLASHTSAPLAEDVVLTNKVSQNLHAELLFHHLGELGFCNGGVGGSGGSILDSARMVRAYLLQAGVDPDDFTFFDGSGLSAHDVVTPRAMATFLAYAAKQPWFAAWKASLPEGGEDGGLDTRFAAPPVKDHLFAKTGTLGETHALSGYLDTATGRTIIFSILVDTHAPGTSADRVAMDKIVAAIAADE
jgi:D-alanyl-D-alanine carboxypeptidase/D-alanyl-D-alanine-endopeptidase (penicillin-binding protein 4)